MSLAIAAPVEGACPTRPEPDDGEDYEALLDEIYAIGHVYETELSVGGQHVWRLRRRSAEHRPDRLLSLLGSLKPRLEEMQSYFTRPPSRPVLLIETRLDIFGSTMAFTDCASPGAEGDAAEESGDEEDEKVELAKHFVSELEGEADSDWADELRDLPEGLCLIVVFPDRIENDRERRFVLAHEWMHAMQSGFYTRRENELHWWVEGSAEWLAHKVVEGTTERDRWIEEFFMRQKSCSLTQHSYDAQPFFFWGEQAFNADWVFSVGLGGDEYLTRPERAAEILPPERWLDWAIAQADQTITMPDGRPLPAQAEAEPLALTKACDAVIEGPPLSVQLREISLPRGGVPKLQIDAGDAQFAIRGRDDEDWRRVSGAAEIDMPAPPIKVAAIMPSGENLNARLSMGASGATNCACQIGAWMEQPTPDEEAEDPLSGALEALDAARGMVPPDQMDDFLATERKLRAANAKDRFRFRGAIPAIFDELEGDVETVYDQDGPIVTIQAGGTFTIDDPHTIRGGDTTIRYYKYRPYGRWRIEDGVLKIDIEGLLIDGFVTSGPDYEPKRIKAENEGFGAASYVGGGGDWTMACEASGMTLTSTRVRDPDRSDQAVLVKQ
ncbi:hypothetical protein [Hyphococcus luteus]|uniref:Uncharacterized protein n=1 Tax=Hyphococcus luteus TaxID=2058213 RepID=A0A2S7K2L4_9PROT|nr:hypothetical protein [Marinicaulis flavus]PQA86733.1 hypothetical protein CW354_14685 [Marinicaulis flavus]